MRCRSPAPTGTRLAPTCSGCAGSRGAPGADTFRCSRFLEQSGQPCWWLKDRCQASVSMITLTDAKQVPGVSVD